MYFTIYLECYLSDNVFNFVVEEKNKGEFLAFNGKLNFINIPLKPYL